MPEKIDLISKSGIIYITSYGEVTEEDLISSLETIIKISENKDFLKVLVDAREQSSLPSPITLFKFSQKLSESFRHIKHAIVVSDSTPEDINFIETVAVNRGSNMQIFNSIDAAVSWLNKS